MDSLNKTLLALCVLESAIIIALHLFYSREIHKLLDKLMSRDYRDYHTTHAPPKREHRIELPEVPEDLRVLQGFQIP